ncbi:hypothetical protein HFN16_01135 [Pseudodesulfovibrio sp. zrk46]|nr:hypothetical protein HFN16_01135 [Pseudodesulfovibrio sp. zrk46]
MNPYGVGSYSNSYSLLQTLSSQSETQSSDSTTDSSSANWKTQIRNSINAILADVPKGDDGKLSFDDVDTYRKSLEEKWDEEVKADLEKLGVDPDSKYPLTWDPTTGKVIVQEGHPDKAVIDKYFEDNPDKVEEFQKIIQLGKLTSTSRSTLSPTEMRQSIQQQSMAWWYEDNSDPRTWFSGGSSLMGFGSSAYTGLNITV